MSETTAKLREVASIKTGVLYSRRKMLNDAADEIERLRASDEQLAEALDQCQRALAMLIEPQAILTTSVMSALASVTSAEVGARAALTAYRKETAE